MSGRPGRSAGCAPPGARSRENRARGRSPRAGRRRGGAAPARRRRRGCRTRRCPARRGRFPGRRERGPLRGARTGFEEVAVDGRDDRAERQEHLQDAVDLSAGFPDVDERRLESLGLRGQREGVETQRRGLEENSPGVFHAGIDGGDAGIDGGGLESPPSVGQRFLDRCESRAQFSHDSREVMPLGGLEGLQCRGEPLREGTDCPGRIHAGRHCFSPSVHPKKRPESIEENPPRSPFCKGGGS